MDPDPGGSASFRRIRIRFMNHETDPVWIRVAHKTSTKNTGILYSFKKEITYLINIHEYIISSWITNKKIIVFIVKIGNWRKKSWNCLRIRSRIHYFESGSTDPDPDQNEIDPQHCKTWLINSSIKDVEKTPKSKCY